MILARRIISDHHGIGEDGDDAPKESHQVCAAARLFRCAHVTELHETTPPATVVE
jgi:hypothetical protein